MNIINFFAFPLIFFLIDLVWLIGGRGLHQKTYTSVTKENKMNVNPIAALLFYLLTPIAFYLFVKRVAKNKREAFFYGMVMGLIMYGTYDFTSKAIYNQAYSWGYTFLDVSWGSLLFGVVSFIFY